uniref:Uncharacterized protein n=1 Tax=Chelonoidis abingdonii TaxID=106734 RepID=A0A8C0QJI2_CHEAB
MQAMIIVTSMLYNLSIKNPSKNQRFTSFPNWFTGVYCDCSLDFLLCHLHAVIENLKELFRFLIFC